MFAAEKKVTSWAEIAPNGYFICIFACDRQIYQPNLNVFTHVWKIGKDTDGSELNTKYKKAMKKNDENIKKYIKIQEELQSYKDKQIPIIT